ncbi:MAG: hypothetical protein P4M12_10455 [Gammaproteobacteria bacterium]|nr:hypothetical protein [Gammaproteobacteria bacterium]
MSIPRNNNLLIEHVIKADETEAEKMLQQGFSMFDIGEATDFSGRKCKGSAFELAAVVGDDEMLEMMKRYLKNNRQEVEQLKAIVLGEREGKALGPASIALASEWLAELEQKVEAREAADVKQAGISIAQGMRSESSALFKLPTELGAKIASFFSNNDTESSSADNIDAENIKKRPKKP